MAILRRMWRDELSHRQVTALFDIRGLALVVQWGRGYLEGGIDALTPLHSGPPERMGCAALGYGLRVRIRGGLVRCIGTSPTTGYKRRCMPRPWGSA